MTDVAATATIPQGEALLNAGWYQGAVFTAPPLSFICNDVPDPGSEESVALRPRKPRSREKLILITQDCDIKSTSEPYVEAMICAIERRQDYLARIDRNSSRWFVVAPEAGLVAEAKYRVSLSKELLATLSPEPWPSSPERHRRFIRWLGRRYDRPAVPDEIIEVFQRPVEVVLNRIDAEQPAVLATFNRVVHEVRVNTPLREEPPFDLHLILLIQADSLSEEEADAIDTVVEEIYASIDPEKVELDDTRILTPETMSVEEYFATRPMFLEYHSYKGDEQVGAEPLSAE